MAGSSSGKSTDTSGCRGRGGEGGERKGQESSSEATLKACKYDRLMEKRQRDCERTPPHPLAIAFSNRNDSSFKTSGVHHRCCRYAKDADDCSLRWRAQTWWVKPTYSAAICQTTRPLFSH